nr:hypothetical protein [Lysinibacillus parviboronicapiens]
MGTRVSYPIEIKMKAIEPFVHIGAWREHLIPLTKTTWNTV